MTRVELYAELLLNIRQVTVFATLLSPSTDSTKSELSADGRHLSILHDGARTTLELPCQVTVVEVLRPTPNHKELSFRLSIADGVRASVSHGESEEQTSVWPASALSAETQVACQSCRNIVAKDKISAWKDLPSENWAEMMDFWHCHKPDITEAANVASEGSAKGYAAFNALEPRPGAALVDTLHIHIATNDCTGIEVGLRSRCVVRAIIHFFGLRATRRRRVSTACWINGISADTIAPKKIPCCVICQS